MSDQAKHTILRLTQKEFGDWLEMHGRQLYRDIYAELRADLDEVLRRQDARWQSLNARVEGLAAAVSPISAERRAGTDAETRRALEEIAKVLYALRSELRDRRSTHRDPFNVFAALLRDLRPERLRAGHAIRLPRAVDDYVGAARSRDPAVQVRLARCQADRGGARELRPQVHGRAGRRRVPRNLCFCQVALI